MDRLDAAGRETGSGPASGADVTEVMMNTWTKQYTRVIDQRLHTLPPTWIPREKGRDGTRVRKQERGRAVHVSGPDRAVAKRIVSLLGETERMAVVSSFLLADRTVEDAMLEAAGRGVRVYVLLASEARLGSEPRDGEFERRVLAEHEDMLQRLGGRVLIRSAPHFHAKLVLVDPDAKKRRAGLLLTANLTREALERNEELAVELTPDEVEQATAIVRWAMWESAEHELVDPTDFRAAKSLGCIAHPVPAPHVLATTASATQLREEAFELIESASGELVVASFGWDAGHPVVERLCARAREGLSLTVLARIRLRAMPALIALAEAGARVLGFRWLHAKALWADSGRGLVMSANLEQHGLDDGFELGLRLQGKRAEELRMRLERWSGRAACELRPEPALSEVTGTARAWHDGELVDLDVTPRLPVDLGVVTAASADALFAPDEPEPPRTDALPQPGHELECRWLVQPPRLHPKAKEVMRPPTPLRRAIDAGVIRVVNPKAKEATTPAAGEPETRARPAAKNSGAKAASQQTAGKRANPTPYQPPVFREPDGRLVVAIQSPEEVPGAREVAAEVGAATIVVRAEPGSRPR